MQNVRKEFSKENDTGGNLFCTEALVFTTKCIFFLTLGYQRSSIIPKLRLSSDNYLAHSIQQVCSLINNQSNRHLSTILETCR